MRNVQDAVSALSSLSRLQALCLADPFWGACPVASLSNYQTCVLAQLLQLTSLDTLVLAQETKAAAAATLAKKQLYYSMRTTTLRRAMRDLCRHAQAAQQVRRSAEHGWASQFGTCLRVANAVCSLLRHHPLLRDVLPVQAQAQQWLETYGKLAHATKCLEFSAESVTEEQRQQQQVGACLSVQQADSSFQLTGTVGPACADMYLSNSLLSTGNAMPSTGTAALHACSLAAPGKRAAAPASGLPDSQDCHADSTVEAAAGAEQCRKHMVRRGRAGSRLDAVMPGAGAQQQS